MDDAHDRGTQDKCIVVGIDIGTTKRINEDEPMIVRGWPSPLGSPRGPERDEDKVPTLLLLDDEGNVKSWGYEVADGNGIPLGFFKLATIPEKDLPPYLRESEKLKHTKKQMQDLGLNATQVIEKYIQMIWAHAQGRIRRATRDRAFQSTRIKVVITIPAIWGNTEKRQMESAAATSILESGRGDMTTYEFVSEPEAAVQAYEKSLAKKLGKNEIVLVVDNGGGTADIIPYENVGEQGEQFKLREAASGNGGLYGAMVVDEAFENLALSKLPEGYENLKTESPSDWKTILSEQWEHRIKRAFTWTGSGRKWTFKLSNVASRGNIILHEDEIREVFNSVIPGIIRLVREQIDQVKKTHDGRGPRIILPVGGFGRCPYILQRLEEEFGGKDPPGRASKRARGGGKKKQLEFEKIEVHTEDGDPPWIAVARGACKAGIRALSDNHIVEGRYARISVCFCQYVEPTAKEPGIWVPDFDGFMIPYDLVWIVKKGDWIPSNGELSIKAMELPCELGGTGIRSERSTFYKYTGDVLPDRFDPNDPGFREYGVMEITATKLIEDLPTVESPCGGRPVFHYDLKRKAFGSSVEVTAISAHPEDDGREVGKLVLPELDMV